MMLAPIIFILFFGAAFSAETVKYVAIIFRHGDRTPVDTYPTDPWRNESLWPVKFGQLTNTGKQQHFAFGQWLRKKYSHVISPMYDPSEIYVRSTDVDRTLMSAQANLAGLYPPSGTAVWNIDLLWQPIPVHTVPEKEDNVLAMKKPCPAFLRERDRYTHSTPYLEELGQYQSLMDYLTAYTGLKVKNFFEIDNIFSILYIEHLYNFTLPNWTNSVFPNKMAEPAGRSFTELTATPLMARLMVGPILQQITSHMYRAMSKTNHIKMAMYSGHDITVGSFLNALGMFDGRCPVYTAAVFVELVYDNTTQVHSVRISYKNTTELVEPHVLQIPHCGDPCPIARFVHLHDHLLSVHWDFECNRQFPQLLGISFFVGLGIFITIYITHRMYFIRLTRQRGGFDMRYSGIRPPASPVMSSDSTTPECAKSYPDYVHLDNQA